MRGHPMCQSRPAPRLLQHLCQTSHAIFPTPNNTCSTLLSLPRLGALRYDLSYSKGGKLLQVREKLAAPPPLAAQLSPCFCQTVLKEPALPRSSCVLSAPCIPLCRYPFPPLPLCHLPRPSSVSWPSRSQSPEAGWLQEEEGSGATGLGWKGSSPPAQTRKAPKKRPEITSCCELMNSREQKALGTVRAEKNMEAGVNPSPSAISEAFYSIA